MGRIITLPNVLVIVGGIAVIGGLSASVCFREQAVKANRNFPMRSEYDRVIIGREVIASRELRDVAGAAKVKAFGSLLVAGVGGVCLLAGGIMKLMQGPTDRDAADDEVPAEWLE